MKKVLSVFITSLIIVFCTTFVVFATEDNSAKLIVSYDMNESYTVVIPADFTIGSSGKASADITASNVVIDDGKFLEISITGDDYIDSWLLIDTENSSNFITYAIGSEEDGNDIENNSVVLSISAGEIYDSTITKTLYFSIEDEITKSGTYVDTLTFTANITGEATPPTPPPEEEDVIYYSSLTSAITGTDVDGDADASTGRVAVTSDDETGIKTVKILDDMDLSNTTLNIEESLTLDLNGHEINVTQNPADAVFIRNRSENLVIDGSDSGSAITVNTTAGQKGTILSNMAGTLTINGGTYTANTSGAGTYSSSKANQTQAIYTYTSTTLNVSDATIIATDSNNGCVNGVTGKADSTMTLTNCDVTVNAGTSLENRGVHAEGDAVLRDCNIIAKADYTATKSAYTSNSRGVWCQGRLEMYDCYVYGSHAGVTVQGTAYVDGGTYNGYGHGGIYLSGTSGPHYFYNAEFNWAPMAEGTVADSNAGTNGAGFYIGGKSNQTAYFDNCDFNMIDGGGADWNGTRLPLYGIVMRTSGGESNSVVYISNSYVEEANTQMFRGPGANNHTVYNGVGNDWSNATVVHKTNSTYFIDTEDSYAEE